MLFKLEQGHVVMCLSVLTTGAVVRETKGLKLLFICLE